MNCDVAHKVMRTDTVLDLLMRCRREDERGFETTFKQKVLGITVLTKYNNKTYRIDDVDFNITPASKFMKKNVETTIQQYYKEVSPGNSNQTFFLLILIHFIFFLLNRNTNWKYEIQRNRF